MVSKDYIVDAGGDIACRNGENSKEEAIKIGLENPENFSEIIGIAELRNQSICGSSGNRRAWGNIIIL